MFGFPAVNHVLTRDGRRLLSDVLVGAEIRTLDADFSPKFTTVTQVHRYELNISDYLRLDYSTGDFYQTYITPEQCLQRVSFKGMAPVWAAAATMVRGFRLVNSGLTGKLASKDGLVKSIQQPTPKMHTDLIVNQARMCNIDSDTVIFIGLSCEPYKSFICSRLVASCVPGLEVDVK